MQPLLLLKQTLEATYDPGALLLSDSHVRFTDASQILAKKGRGQVGSFQVGIEVGEVSLAESFSKSKAGNFSLDLMILGDGPRSFEIRAEMTDDEIRRKLGPGHSIERDRCFLCIRSTAPGALDSRVFTTVSALGRALRSLIHIPGLRGNPERAYPVAAVGKRFVGPFPVYAASVILAWQEQNDLRLKILSTQLHKLGLTWKVEARQVDATRVELNVGRLKAPTKGGPKDLVNIADAGFGVSQTLPVLVALLTAAPGQLVYLEQPEIHLHPRAQVVLAEILCEAARRGVKVVAETHSSLLLIAVQALVAEGKLDPERIKLHWFRRDNDGSTVVSSGDLDEAGAYGDWPEDFGEAELTAQKRYLDAAEARDLESAPRARKTKTARR
ncbi:MAG TPA: AAA family ATPase [Thermoanaerobaculia bacterium]|nr:AAA family ATPase [Thermoanaerobaculia bacterium]